MKAPISIFDQLIACAFWNAGEADKAAAASRDGNFSREERDYFSRRAKRLSAQAAGLFEQADELEFGL